MCKVVSWPSTTFAIESPTRIRSTPAAEATGPRLVVGGHHHRGIAPFRRFRTRIAGALSVIRPPLVARSRSRGARAARTGRPLSHEVVERTSHAHLDGVTLHRLFASLQFQQFRARRRTVPPEGNLEPKTYVTSTSSTSRQIDTSRRSFVRGSSPRARVRGARRTRPRSG